MIDFDGTDLIGLESGTNGFTIDPEAGFDFGLSPDQFTWAERRIGGLPVGSPQRPNMETEIPMIYVGSDEDAVLEAVGGLRQTCEKIRAQSGLGGTEIGWQKLGATYQSTLICYSAEIGKVKIGVDDKRMTVARFALKITCAPYVLGPEYTAASGTKPAGMPAADITIPDVKGDLPGPARIVVTNQGTVAQQLALMGLQWRQAVAGNSLLLRASTFDVSTSPLHGTYTAGTNEVQQVGVIPPTGGTWALSWEGHVFSAAFAHNASVATVQAAIDAQVGAGNITVSGYPISTSYMNFTFTGDFASRNVAQMVFDGTSLVGSGGTGIQTTYPGVEDYVSAVVFSDWSSFTRIAAQTDTGSYDLWARVYDAGSTANKVLVRAVISIGDTAIGNDNRSVLVPTTGADIWVNLGPVHATPQGVGTHKWTATIQAKTLGTEGTTLRVLDLVKVPSEHGRVVVKTPSSSGGTISMRDNFSAISGAITGDTATSGQTWASMGGVTDADDFSKASGNAVQRTATSDTATNVRYGRGVILGTATPTDVTVSVDIVNSTSVAVWQGVIVHFADSNNFGVVYTAQVGSDLLVGFWAYVGGSVVSAHSANVLNRPFGTTRTLTGTVRASGLCVVSIDGTPALSVSVPAFAAGGALASGRSGLIDWHTGAGACTRTYSNFTVTIPTPEEAAIYPSRKLHWSDDGGLHREASGGTDYSYAQGQQGTGVPMLGPEGAEGLNNRLLIASADQNPDYAATGNQLPRLDYTVYHRPAYALGRYGS
ncbi:MAG: hypothetical protein HY827_10305 [Actinobacteria bacterium]|nr:hypothetical protein [Actinomycetota bacterium]